MFSYVILRNTLKYLSLGKIVDILRKGKISDIDIAISVLRDNSFWNERMLILYNIEGLSRSDALYIENKLICNANFDDIFIDSTKDKKINVVKALILNDISFKCRDYTLNKKNHIINGKNNSVIFKLNMILILENNRMGYICDFIKNMEYIDFDKHMIRLNMYDGVKEVIIYLNKNEDKIFSEMSSGLGGDIIFGRILGYCYNGPNFDGTYNKVITIGMIATKNKSEYILYSFNVPIDCYDSEMKFKIEEKRQSHNKILSQYGYYVKADIFNPHGYKIED